MVTFRFTTSNAAIEFIFLDLSMVFLPVEWVAFVVVVAVVPDSLRSLWFDYVAVDP